jgi:predicted RNase H-like HicB family nuclease
MTAPGPDTTSPLAALAAWLEDGGYVLRRVHAGHYVFRHPATGQLVAAPADPPREAVARISALVTAGTPVERTPRAPAATFEEPSERELLASAAALAGAGYERAVTPLEGGRYLVEVPSFGAVIGHGGTIEDAYRSAQDALTASIAVLLEDGEGVPALPAAAASGTAAPEVA